MPAISGLSWKIKPVLDTLSDTLVRCYSPSQELSVDEAMVKYKGHVEGTVLMPKKPRKKVSRSGGVCVPVVATMVDLEICRRVEKYVYQRRA